MERFRRALNDLLVRGDSPAAGGDDELAVIREAFDQTSVGLTLVSLEGEFFIVNRAFCELSGYSREELVGMSEMVMPGDNISMTVELISPIAMEKELRFAIREGGRTVGAGVVTEVLE